MTTRSFATICSVSALVLITACSSNPPRSDPYRSAPGVVSNAAGYGNVSNIELVSVASRSSAGGAVLGAVIGAAIGNQIGSGTGRAAATGLGAVGGAVIGNNIQPSVTNSGQIRLAGSSVVSRCIARLQPVERVRRRRVAGKAGTWALLMPRS